MKEKEKLNLLVIIPLNRIFAADTVENVGLYPGKAVVTASEAGTIYVNF